MTEQGVRCDGDCYQRGMDDARRTIEAEIAAERAGLAMLATSLVDAVDGLRVVLHPGDALRLAAADESLPIEIDASLLAGEVRVRLGDCHRPLPCAGTLHG